MSKITQAKKEAKKQKVDSKLKTKVAKTLPANVQLPNYGCCCTCQYYDKPCRKIKDYTPRKAQKDCYKMKG